MYSVGLYTLGCKVSQYETEALAERFEDAGFAVCDFSSVCDVYVVNTCTVTAESDRKCRQVIRRAAKTNPRGIIMVMGCYSQREPNKIAEIDGVYAVVGTENKLSLVDTALKLLSEREDGIPLTKRVEVTDVTRASFEPMRIRRAPRTRAYVKIEDGCESKCTYCAISLARGRVRSKPKEDVIREVRALHNSGVREIVLTGIETGSYGKDFAEKYTLADLLSELDAGGCAERIRLGSLAPELIDADFIRKVRSLKTLAPHFHLSLQSGSDAVLRAMKRRYNSKMAMSVIDSIRENIEGATFTTDLMVGFPGETDADFLETVDFVRRARFLDAHVFAYSRRAGTPAAYYENQVPESVKRLRSEELIRVKDEVRDELLSELVKSKKPLSAIVEMRGEDGYYTAHSDTYVEIKFASELDNLTGELITLVPVSHKCGIVYCEMAKI